MPKKPRTLPRREEMVSESNDPKWVSQMRMYKGPLSMLSLKDYFNGMTGVEARFLGLE